MMPIPLLFLILAGQGARFDTDTVVSVPAGARLRLQNQGGDIAIKTWDRNQVRIQATHSSRSYVDVEIRGSVVELNARSRHGIQSLVDYQLTVPVSMALEVGGMYAEISIEGTRAPVKAQTLDGNITLRGGAESVNLTTVSGKIDVSGARGRIELHAVSEDIRANDIQGDLTIESVSGSIDLRRIDSKAVDAQTVSGDITYEGRLVDGGTYAFNTHSGEVTLAVPENSNATLRLASASGDVSSSFSLKTEQETRRRHTYRMGDGSATVDVETFSGDLRVIRASELRPRRDDDERDHDGPKIKVKPRSVRPERDRDNDEN
jgi:DUF4097 and DUF4098 domain-containing protein YvlB